MSTENEAGSGPAAEPAAPATDGAQAAQTPAPSVPHASPAPSVPPAPPVSPADSARGEERTEILPEVSAQDPYAAPAPAPAPSPYAPPPPPPGSTPSPYDTPPSAAFGAEPPHAGHGSGSGMGSDPFGSPVPPPYAGPHAQPGPGGPGGPAAPMWGTQVPHPPNSPKRRGVGGLLATVLVAALVGGGVGGGVGYWAGDRHHSDSPVSSTTVSDGGSQKAFNRSPTSVAGIANKALPSVVTIKASGSQESGTGTGFVYDTQGHILTNNHVVAPAADGGKLTVTFSNGKTYDAQVVGRAQGYDVAVVKLKNPDGVKLTPLPLGNSDNAAVGDATIAIGAPFGLSGTVTTGIVSAVHRPVASSDGQGSSASYMSAIQTDASINPGNSGGPLLNANGAVIGINSAIQSATNNDPSGGQAGSVGLGFAIPINQAKRVADQLIQTGKPVYPLIGVSLDTQFQGDGAKISTASGAITPNGPGAAAGLQPGDVITKFDDTQIDSGQTLIGEIWQHSPGDKATITYDRGGKTHTTTVTLGSRVGDS